MPRIEFEAYGPFKVAIVFLHTVLRPSHRTFSRGG